MVPPVGVKVALTAVSDKPQLSETQRGNGSGFAGAVIHFGVPGPVAAGDPETVLAV